MAHIKVYDSPYGRVNVHLERTTFLDADNIIALDRSMWKWGMYRRTWMEEPPKDGDRWRGVIQVEHSLKDLNGRFGASMINCATS